MIELVASICAGIIGNLIGGIFAIIFGKKQFINNFSINIAAGIMLAVVFCDMLADSISLLNVVAVVCFFSVGVLIMLKLSNSIDNKAITIDNYSNNIASHIIIGIALHNFPEGMALASDIVVNASLSTAILIGIHNIQEGLVLSMPIVNKRQWYSIVLICILAGIPTILGALFISIVGDLPNIVPICLSLASGAMFEVTMCDLIPISNSKDKKSFISLTIGLVFGMVIIYAI